MLRIPSTDGRSVCLCWAKSKPKGPKGGGRKESAREDVLCICTLHVPTREKGGCVERRGGIERASGCTGFRGEMNFGPEAGFDHVKVPNRGSKEHETMRRVEKGETFGRATVLQDTMSIAVNNSGFLTQGESGGG